MTEQRPNERLRAARMARGLSQAACAAALEQYAWAGNRNLGFQCGERKFRRWEAGDAPQPDAVPILTGYFEMSAAELGCSPAPGGGLPPRRHGFPTSAPRRARVVSLTN